MTRHKLEAAWFALVLLSLLCVAASRAFRGHATTAGSKQGFPGFGLLAIFVTGSFALYWPAIWIGLLSDDFSLLRSETSSALRINGWDHYRPIPLLAWKLLFPTAGAPALHVLNVVLHGVNAWMAIRLAHRLGHHKALAGVCGLIFLTFPGAVEPVTWSSGLFDVAMVTFGLFYLEASITDERRKFQIVWLVAALLSKETAVGLPIAATALRMGTRMPIRPMLSSVAVTAIYVAIRVSMGLSLPPGSSSSLRYTFKELLGRPFASLSLPYTGSELATHPFILGFLSVTFVAGLIWIYCLKPSAGARPAALGAMVIIGVLPLWRFIAISEDLEGSRYLYLPLVGWSLLLVDLAAQEGVRRRWVGTAALFIMLVCPGIWYTRMHLEKWEKAAQVRDAVLRSAAQVLNESKCATAEFRNVPDSREGVYIFRNGFSEAIDGRAVAAGGTTPPACEFVWVTDRFTKAE